MKSSFVSLFVLLSLSTFAQPTVRDQFQKITTVDQANQYIAANAALKPALFYVSSKKDSSVISKRLLRQNQGDIFSVGLCDLQDPGVGGEGQLPGELYLFGWFDL
jgi:hypothetical protein